MSGASRRLLDSLTTVRVARPAWPPSPAPIAFRTTSLSRESPMNVATLTALAIFTPPANPGPTASGVELEVLVTVDGTGQPVATFKAGERPTFRAPVGSAVVVASTLVDPAGYRGATLTRTFTILGEPDPVAYAVTAIEPAPAS
jgi:hypothetical protein